MKSSWGRQRAVSAKHTQKKEKIKLIGSSLLQELSARQALSPRVPLTHHPPADDNCIACRRCSAVRISATTIYRLSEVAPVFQQQEQNMPDRLRARVPCVGVRWRLCSRLCIFFFHAMLRVAAKVRASRLCGLWVSSFVFVTLLWETATIICGKTRTTGRCFVYDWMSVMKNPLQV